MEIRTHNSNINFTSRKIPRFIYHFTNQNSYQKMCQDGFIKTTDCDMYLKGEGVFMVDWTNFCKRWGYDKSWGEKGTTLQESLIRIAAKWIQAFIKGKNELVILKIPTEKLKRSKLVIRSQQKFFDVKENDKNFNSLSDNLKEHLSGFTPATEYKTFAKRKEAVEFIYKEDIPINITEKIGETINIPEFRATTKYNRENPVKSILKKCLKGLNEAKSLRFIQKKVEDIPPNFSQVH